MRYHNSKFFLIPILTFMVGVGIVLVWQFFTDFSKLEPASSNSGFVQQTIQTKTELSESPPLEPDFCEEIKKNPSYPNAKPFEETFPHDHHHIVSGGVINGKVCDPALLKTWVPGKDFVNVQVTVDENGFVISASTVSSNTKFPKRFEKIAKSLRVRPTVLSGIHVKVTGVLIFKPREDNADK